MKRALVIGLNYPRSPYELNGCEADAQAIAERMQRDGVEVYINRDRRFSADSLFLYLSQVRDVAKPTDVLYVYYSGHGTQAPDASEPDRLKEGLCLWNGSHIEVVYDDDFRRAVLAVPGTVVVILDSCFSGGMQRSTKPGKSRALPFDPAFEISGFKALPLLRKIPGADRAYWLFACSEGEVSWETAKGGYFTVAFCEAFDRLKVRTVGAIMRAVTATIGYEQTPRFEKDGRVSSARRVW